MSPWHPVEAALARSVRWLVPALLVTPLLLFVQVPRSALLPVSIVHLSLLVTYGVIVAADLSRLLEDEWFGGMRPFGRAFASAGSVVALSTGVVALLTLASSAALRYDVSLQFLQLLSSLDIAWAAAAIGIGAYWLWGRSGALIAVVALLVVCVWAIGVYLSVVGFGPSGEWLVDGAALMRHVLPYDMAAAATALSLLIAGARRQATRQPSPQS